MLVGDLAVCCDLWCLLQGSKKKRSSRVLELVPASRAPGSMSYNHLHTILAALPVALTSLVLTGKQALQLHWAMQMLTQCSDRRPDGQQWWFPPALLHLNLSPTDPTGTEEGAGSRWRLSGVVTASFKPVRLLRQAKSKAWDFSVDLFLSLVGCLFCTLRIGMGMVTCR